MSNSNWRDGFKKRSRKGRSRSNGRIARRAMFEWPLRPSGGLGDAARDGVCLPARIDIAKPNPKVTRGNGASMAIPIGVIYDGLSLDSSQLNDSRGNSPPEKLRIVPNCRSAKLAAR